MSRTIEPLSGGLVTSTDPSLLQPGELTRCNDCTYRPNSLSLYRAPGRVRFNQTALSSGVVGLAYCGFDSGSDLLLAQTSTALYKAAVPGTGTYSLLATQAAGASFQAVHYQNRQYLLDGLNRQALLSAGTVRQHGMAPVTAAPALTLTATGGVWPITLAPVPNYYQYWTTEVYKTDTEFVESTFQGDPAAINVTSATCYVTVKKPAGVVNSNATHWRVYRSTAMVTSTTSAFPTGYLISGDIPVVIDPPDAGQDTLLDGIGSPTQTADAYPTAFASAGWPYWSNPHYVYAQDGNSATFQTANGSVVSGQSYNGFPLSEATGSIANIIVSVFGQASAANQAWVTIYLSWNNGTSYTTGQTVLLPSAAPGWVSIGGLWGRTWSPEELATTKFRMAVGGSTNNATFTGYVDAIKVVVAHGASPAAIVTPFPAVVISAAGSTSALGRHGQPPLATTGGIFEDSLVTNDPVNPTYIRYSTQGNPDSFPADYYVPCESDDRDKVTCYRTLGNVGIVGTTTKLYRLMYLPRETDPEFERGRTIDMFENTYGIVGPKAAAVFQMAGGALRLATISHHGPRMTDGYQSDTLSNDLDWVALVEPSRLPYCELINDPTNYRLVFTYTPLGGTANTRSLHFHYHPRHLKDGKLKVSGPITLHANCMALGKLLSGSATLYSGQPDGYAYVENSGNVDTSGNGLAPSVRTREMYMAGFGDEWQLTSSLIHHQSTPTTTVTVSFDVAKTNADPYTTQANKTFTTLRRGFSRISPNVGGEGIAINLTESGADAALALDFMALDWTSYGAEDSLK